jgi:hypothetical protein
MAHFMNWMGAVMSASGFTWCYLCIAGFAVSIIPIEDKETGISAPMLNAEAVQAFFDLGYVVIIFPILGSGLAIMVSSWRAFARRRTVGGGLVAGWNTFAQVHNTWRAVQALPGVFERLGGFFGSGSKSSSNKDSKTIVVVLVILAALGGIVTTYAIIQSKRRAVIVEDGCRA